MKAVFFVLNDTTKLTNLLKELSSLGIHGSTIFQTNGMGRELAKNGDFMITGLLRAMLTPELTTTSTLLFIVEEKDIPTIKKGIYNIVGELSKPNSGILFIMPLEYVEGLKIQND